MWSVWVSTDPRDLVHWALRLRGPQWPGDRTHWGAACDTWNMTLKRGTDAPAEVTCAGCRRHLAQVEAGVQPVGRRWWRQVDADTAPLRWRGRRRRGRG